MPRILQQPLYATRHYQSALRERFPLEIKSFVSSKDLLKNAEKTLQETPDAEVTMLGVWIWAGILRKPGVSAYEIITVPSLEDFTNLMQDQGAEVYVNYLDASHAEVMLLQWNSDHTKVITHIDFRGQIVTPYTARLEQQGLKVVYRIMDWVGNVVKPAAARVKKSTKPAPPVEEPVADGVTHAA